MKGNYVFTVYRHVPTPDCRSPTVSPTLTSGWHCVLKHLIELAEVHDHGEFVGLYHGRHLFARHAGRDDKFPLCHVETQLVVLLLVSLIQGIEVTEERMRQTDEDDRKPTSTRLSNLKSLLLLSIKL